MNAPQRADSLAASVRTPNELVSQLDFLRRRAARGSGKQKVSLDDLVTACRVPRSTLGTYLNGASFPPADVLDTVVIALGCDPAEQRAWAEAWERASAWLARRREQQDSRTHSELFNTSVSIADLVDPDHRIRDRPVAPIAITERTQLDADRHKAWLEYQETVQAEADGADRSIMLLGPNPRLDLASLEITHLVNCAHGRTLFLIDPPIVAIELLFDRPLHRDETYLLSYRVDYRPAHLNGAELAALGLHDEPTVDELRGFRKPIPVYTQEITFQPDDLPQQVHQVFREHQQDPGRDVAVVPVNRWGSAHIAIQNPELGVHGMRWSWPS